MLDLTFQLDTKDLDAAVERMIGPTLMQQVAISLTRAVARAKAAGLLEFVSHGVGRRIFGNAGPSGPTKLVAIDDPIVTADGVRLTVTMKGLVALRERGGHTKPSRRGLVVPKRSGVKALHFAMPNGLGFAMYAHHKGAAVPAHPALIPAMEKVPGEVMADLRATIAGLLAGKAA